MKRFSTSTVSLSIGFISCIVDTSGAEDDGDDGGGDGDGDGSEGEEDDETVWGELLAPKGVPPPETYGECNLPVAPALDPDVDKMSGLRFGEQTILCLLKARL